MHRFSSERSWPVRVGGPAALMVAGLCVALLVPRPAIGGAATGNDHQQAIAALADVKAALAELVQADASYAADPKVYHTAAQRAINALTGADDQSYVASAGTPGDPAGAIGHIDSLLDRSGTLVWTATLESAEANARAAVAHLQDAAKADGFMEYATAATRAIDYLEVARGRPNEIGVFSGIEGVLANTELGVPHGAQQQDACQKPVAAPSYGTHGGYIAWVALPAGDGAHALAEASGTTRLSVQDGMILLHTAAAQQIARECASQAKAETPHAAVAALSAPLPQPAASPTAAPAVSPPAASAPPAPAAAPASRPASATPVRASQLPVLYTKEQAEQGGQVFATNCVACHGANLQGTAAPSVAGNDFLVTANHNGWTLEIMRYIVFDQMPRNSPASLSPAQYASVMAYLLASNCYPAGTKPFPTKDDPAFAKIKLGPVPGPHPHQNAKGVCALN